MTIYFSQFYNHAHCTEQMLNAAISMVKERRLAVLIGAEANVEPISEIIRAFERVVVVNCDEKALKSIAARFPSPKLQTVLLNVQDDQISKLRDLYLESAKKETRTPKAFFDAIVTILEEEPKVSSWVGQLVEKLGNERPNFVSSSLVHTQTLEGMRDAMGVFEKSDYAKQYNPWFSQNMECVRKFQKLFNNWIIFLTPGHINSLSALASPGGVIYFADTVKRVVSAIFDQRRLMDDKLFEKEDTKRTWAVSEKRNWVWVVSTEVFEVFGTILRRT